MGRRPPEGNLFDDCFRILRETEEVLRRARDVFRGLAYGGRELTLEQAAAIALALEGTRKEAAARVIEYERLHDTSPRTR